MRIESLEFGSNRSSARLSLAKAVALFTLTIAFFGERALAQRASKVQTYQEMLIWTGDYDGMIDGSWAAELCKRSRGCRGETATMRAAI
ncbi:hypothetical protein NLM33_46770 (plasmid) [Bradyrhizobium sp. CCGUVB1N3]|uniref:hypothetical protein n=1 Tax=Bradyrhizobium sp. CCGUVB1N3 TaxID=2949629 RepID=UPI0020B29452|nr:hypothetical protein [Bradyrhizobium sp. CCGUVB1N3]MCP3477658.1 hypothetical protein [Bradyrhizobium sp. CCGUVB1N3]